MSLYLPIILIAYLLTVFAGYWLDFLNISHMKKHGASVPKEFEGFVDDTLLKKTHDYVIENTKFEVISSVFQNGFLLFFLFGNLLNVYNSWIASFKIPFILSGLIYFIILCYADAILKLPFDYYHTFKIENRYGFNTISLKLWFFDFLKSQIVSTILIAIIISSGLWIVQISPDFWWFWVWALFLIFSILIMYIFPYVIAPLFNKFTPIENESLVDRISNLMQKVGIKVKSVFQMDASRRTKHTNAYFTGIGKVKRIVLYDTLLEKMDDNEILSVLAHEAGHWKKKHLLKHLVVSEIIALVVMFISYKILQGDFLIHLFHLDESTFFAKIIILSFLGSIIAFPFSPVFKHFSRKHEIEADRFACDLTGNKQSLIHTFIKLSKDNLSNLYPHPLYAFFHYSHPPALERIRQIKEKTPVSSTG